MKIELLSSQTSISRTPIYQSILSCAFDFFVGLFMKITGKQKVESLFLK